MSILGLLSHTNAVQQSADQSSPTLSYRIPTGNLCVLIRQLATLLRAGMPLVPALDALHDQLSGSSSTAEQGLAQVVQYLHQRVNEGTSLSQAMEAFPSLFSSPMVYMVRAGEEGGTLESILIWLAEMMEKRQRLAQNIKAAVTYPLIMAVVAVGVIIYIMIYVIPGISHIFDQFNRALPLPTQILITTCLFLKQRAGAILGVLLIALLGGLWWLRSDQGREAWDRLQLRLPLWGPLQKKGELARMTRTFATLLTAGIPIHKALQISQGVARNHIIQNAWQEITTAVQKGDNMSEAMRSTGIFPPLLCHVVATGHQTGAVDEGLRYVADLLENEVETSTKTLATLLEPLILLVMGGLIGFMVLAILLPIFEINQSL